MSKLLLLFMFFLLACFYLTISLTWFAIYCISMQNKQESNVYLLNGTYSIHTFEMIFFLSNFIECYIYVIDVEHFAEIRRIHFNCNGLNACAKNITLSHGMRAIHADKTFSVVALQHHAIEIITMDRFLEKKMAMANNEIA